jgi:FkbM family methyltransferase
MQPERTETGLSDRLRNSLAVALAAVRTPDARAGTSTGLLAPSCRLSTYGGTPNPAGGPGNLYGQWTLCTDGLGPSTRVISIGISHDVTFDVSMVRRHGARVFCFDPTINAAQFARAVRHTNASKAERGRLRFWPFGLGHDDEVAEFYRTPRWRGALSSARTIDGRNGSTYMRLPLLRLQTLLTVARLTRADVVKIDVEGAEWRLFEYGHAASFFAASGGLADLLREAPPMQLALEMHADAIPNLPTDETAHADERRKPGAPSALKRAAVRQMHIAVTALMRTCGYTRKHVTTHPLLTDVLYTRTHAPTGRCAEKS